jgi:hypothetical protein
MFHFFQHKKILERLPHVTFTHEEMEHLCHLREQLVSGESDAEMVTSREPTTTDRPLQIAHLRSLMQRVDTEWEELSLSIQADKELLSVLQQRLEFCCLILALQREQPLSSTSALETRVAALELQMARLVQHAALANARRTALMWQFERARLARGALRRSMVRPRCSHATRYIKIAHSSMKRLLHGLWLVLVQTGQWSMLIPGDQFIENHS